eukprot:TRINITY_DN3077_c0_g2_i1.p2 TRINITY_DN3077_c0_g2~~TRINITY_DN3077_c0_g2_i1.p2  ORF type:complete len:115 (-),score=20.17 TRINITY_DN3077_c0_g2_i1:191-535(-)
MDTTQDGEVTMTEFEEFAYPEATIQDIEHLSSKIDFDSNGSIGVDEFVHDIALHKQRFGDVAVGLVCATLRAQLTGRCPEMSRSTSPQPRNTRRPVHRQRRKAPPGSKALWAYR